MKKLIFIEVLILLLLSTPPLFWLHDAGKVVLGHDSGFRINYLQYFTGLFYSWNPNVGFGADLTINKGFLVTQFPETFFSYITGSLRTGEMITFVFWFFAIGISMYILTKAIFPNKQYRILRLSASTMYMYNFFVLQGWFIAERAKFSILTALPLGLLILYKTLTREYSLTKGTILFSLIFFLFNGGGNPTLYGSVLLVYFITFIFLTVVNCMKKGIREILRSILVVILFSLGFVAINAYWIVPQISLFFSSYNTTFSAQGGIQGILSWENEVNKYASLINLFRMQGIPDWYNNPLHPYAGSFIAEPILVLASFIPIVVLLLGGMYIKTLQKEGKSELFLILLFVIFIASFIFTAGSHPPFGFFYILLIKYIPGFAIFRSAFYKFGPALWFSFAVLFAYGLQVIFHRFFSNKKFAQLLWIPAVVLILMYHYPYFTANFFNWSVPWTTKVVLPSYVARTSDYINSMQSKIKRIMLYPSLDTYLKADSYEWGYWSLDLLPRISLNVPVVANDSTAPEIVSFLYQSLSRNDEEHFLRLSGLLGINALLWRGDVLYSDKKTAAEDLQPLQGKMEQFGSIRKDSDFGSWAVYSINSPYEKPNIYSTNTINYHSSNENAILNIANSQGENTITRVAEGLTTDQLQTINPFVSSFFVSGECIFCRRDETIRLQSSFQIPYVHLLPDSLFYFTVIYRENEYLKAHGGTPTSQIESHMFIAMKRLVEMLGISKRERTEENITLMRDLAKRYSVLVDGAVEKLEAIPSEREKNLYLIREIAFFKMNNSYLDLSYTEYGLPFDIFQKLSQGNLERIKKLSQQVWVTENSNNLRYYVDIADSGKYSFAVNNPDGTITSFLLNGQRINLGEEYEVQKGLHKVQIISTGSRSGSVVGNLNGKHRLSPVKKVQFPLSGLDGYSEYIVSFEHKLIHGSPVVFTHFGRKDASSSAEELVYRLKLNVEKNDRWTPLTYRFHSSYGLENTVISFSYEGADEKDSEFEIKDFTVTKVATPIVVAERKVGRNQAELPKISYNRIDPTKYIVTVKDARQPFILNFGEAFHKGWNAYIVSAADPIPERAHFPINTYANGWIIHKTGNYTIVVEFLPQRFVYAGVIITSVVIFVFSVVLILLRKKI